MSLTGTRFIPLHDPEIRGNEQAYLMECLETNWLSSGGPFVERFEADGAAFLGAPHAVATSSGTAALHLALVVSGIEPDDEVLVPAFTFIATANAVRYVGAWPVFIDSEPNHYQIDPEKLRRFLERECVFGPSGLRNRTTGRRIRAVVPVHMLGHPCDMDPVLELARTYDLRVIEDATEAIGARYKGRMVGRLGDVSCFSFNGNKVITAGGGGLLVTEREDWATRARRLSTQCRDDPIEYTHEEVGFNYRLSNLHAAVGCAQLEQVERYIAAKRAIASEYNTRFQDVEGITTPSEAEWAYSIFWLYCVRIDPDRFGIDSRELLRGLRESGIQTRPLWTSLPSCRAYADAQSDGCEVAQMISREALCLPCSVGLSEEDLERVAAAVRESRRSRPSAPSCSVNLLPRTHQP
jgi:perosamine synthetase